MEGIVIWIVIIIGWALLKGVFSAVTGSGGDDSSIKCRSKSIYC